ncbi:MAG: succinate dehydrogenase iron-sulfur subunit [Nitrospinaceae bacterium]|nr:succinate dehydrogenase iron-sulfur subunit [Nitrospinaceae bacterium]NIR56491.1 succinate dehydrogenase iron-sulfur subunit [Nitrospinaceae bacterium]NIS86949.1 succinate dehydrogenase iron-sulfur subunit [Nitrospinaceae bacterium]NIT83793.1 succinate dehydrogenase iron-sulfur subunit [Nitrospinaceae bacterium]NIU45999.1 succinate dehydrogenase iron-sulfur subunit [Nitrospinaceae bacterium]
MEPNQNIRFKIKRQDQPDTKPYWQEFELPYKSRANVISCLMDIQMNPVTREGKEVAPVVWECNCLEEVCGACTMVVNGQVRQACTALVDALAQPIILEPLSKFPIVRDLHVDRSRMFENLKKVKAWIHVDGTHDIGEGPIISEKQRAKAYVLSECMTCGCCLEACPQFTRDNDFMGASTFSQVRLFNQHPTGAMEQEERLDAIMGAGGIADCGNAQVCVEVCPKNIPLTESIAEIGRETTLQLLRNLFLK